MKNFVDTYKKLKIANYITSDGLMWDTWNGVLYHKGDNVELFSFTSHELICALLLSSDSEFNLDDISYDTKYANLNYRDDEIGSLGWFDIYDLLTGNPQGDEGYGLSEKDAAGMIDELGNAFALYVKEVLGVSQRRETGRQEICEGYISEFVRDCTDPSLEIKYEMVR